jgi:HK97 gp10 family phage protein
VNVTMPQLAGIFALAAERLNHGEHEILEKTCVLLEDSAKNAIGNDDYIFGWPRLAQSTIDRKGFERPLYETGELQRSIEHNVDDRESFVGTDNPIAKFQEFGTSRIPARPFLGGALIAKEHEIGETVVAEVEKLFK